MAIAPLIEWVTPEHHQSEKSREWYWAVGIIAGTGAILAFLFGNKIFAVFIIVGAFALTMNAHRTPRQLHVEINDRGLVIDKTLYPFQHLESFWVDVDHHEPRLIIKSRKTFMPFISLILRDIDDEDVRQIMLKYIAEVEHPEPLGKRVLELLGF